MDAEREKASRKSIFTAVFGVLFVDTALSLWILWFVRVYKGMYLALGCVIFLIPRDLQCNMPPQQGAHLGALQ